MTRLFPFSTRSLIYAATFGVALFAGTEARAEESSLECSAPTPSPWSSRFVPTPGRVADLRGGSGSEGGLRLASTGHLARFGASGGRRLAQLARSTTPATSREISVEVVDVAPGRPRRVERFTIPVLERGSSKVQSRVGNTEYEIGVRQEGDEADAPLGFDVSRSERGPIATSSEAKVRASLRIKPGQRATIARISRADGSRTEVVATLK